ncbi:MAG: FtsX-like permease family protein [Acidobacteriota bacterium]
MRPLLNFARIACWFVLRQWRLKLWRSLAVIVGVGLGASVFLSVRLAVNASVEAFSQGMDALTGTASLSVASPGFRVDDSLVGRLLRLPGVVQASPVISAYVKDDAGGPVRFVGVDPLLDRAFRGFGTAGGPGGASQSVNWMDLMAVPGTALLGKPLAQRLGVEEGGRFTLRHAGRDAAFTVLAVLAPEGLAGVEGGNVVVADISTAQEFLGLAGKVDRIDLKLAPGVPAESVDAVLPPGVRAAPPGDTRESGLAMIQAYQLNLTVLSFVSLFVGMFLVYSLVSLDAASRRKELAVLRSLGAGPGTVSALFLFQGGMLGALGWLAGMPAAAALTGWMLAGVSSTVNNLFVRVAVQSVSLDPLEIGLSLGVTVAVALLASIGPAVRAMRVSPREAMSIHRREENQGAGAGRVWAALGLFLAVGAWPVSMLPSPTGFPLPGYLSIFLLFTGLALLSPLALRLTIALAAPLARLGGVPAGLASAQAGRGGNRAAVSVGALATAMALFLALSTMIHSFRAGFVTWLDQTVTGDLFVRPAYAELNGYRDTLPPELTRWLAARGDVDVVPYQRRYLSLGRTAYQFEATDMPGLLKYSRFAVLESLPDAEALLLSGQGVAIAEALANQAGLKAGDRFRVQVGAARVDAVVAMVVRSYRTRGGEAYYDLAAFTALGGESGVGGLRVYFKDRTGDLAAKAEALRAQMLAEPWGPGVEAVPGTGLHKVVTGIFDETFAITGVLLVIALGVAALGVCVTLTVGVLERMRQINTLLAVGASRGQITAMVLWEAVYLGLAGEIVGVIGGTALSVIIIYVINRQSFGWTFVYLPDWRALALSLPLILAAVLAAGPPACRAALSRTPALILRER